METNPPQLPTQPKNSGLAIWSLVLGILGLLFLLVCIGPLFAIPAVICGHIAHSRIKRSGGALEGQGLALAGLITGYITIGFALILIPFMAAIAIPNFVKARDTAQKNTCINNLRLIDAAEQQWALENNKTADAVPTAEDLDKYLPAGHTFESLHCPKGGTYTINRVDEPPTCSIPEHTWRTSAPDAQKGYRGPGITLNPGLNYAASNRNVFGPFHSRSNFNTTPSSNQIAEMRAAQEKTACTVNLFMIGAAKRRWASINHKPSTAVPTEDDLLPYLPGRKLPVCPSGGEYTLGGLDEDPACSIPGHVAPHRSNRPAAPSAK